MLIQEGYRWNIPVISYGFDPEFVAYFGQAGVDEVEKAIAIFNALPPASEMSATLDEFPLDTKGQNGSADTLSLLDLKSHALALVLEQLGLAMPERYVWSLRSRNASPADTNYTVLNLNYDPLTWQASQRVNGVLYDYLVWDALGIRGDEWASAVEWFQFDPDFQPYSSVIGGLGSRDEQLGSGPELFAAPRLDTGHYFTGLTRDDIGGLRFLLSRENKRWEASVPGMTAAGSNGTNYVNVALRPGVDKLMFQRQHLDSLSGEFRPVTNVVHDIYFTNDVAVTQTLQRVVTTPDILFRVRDLGGTVSRYTYQERELTDFFPRLFDRSDTSKWVNHATLNDRGSHAGPGVIRPPVHITFNTLGLYAFATGGNYVHSWGSFDASDAPPVIFWGNETNAAGFVVETRLVRTNETVEFEWTMLKRLNLRYRIEFTTNLTDWFPLTTIEPYTDSENAFTLRDPVRILPRFFRSIQEPRGP